MDLTSRFLELNWVTEVIIASIATCILCFGFKKSSELSKHALQNTVATLLVSSANIYVVLLFVDDLNAYAQAFYKSLNIPTLAPDTWGNVPFWIVCLVGIMAKDLVDYWNHRLMHTKWAWPTHAAHHSDTYVNAFSTFRIHIFEFLLMTWSYIVLLTWLQMPQAIPIVVIFYTLHNMYVHMDLDFGHGPAKYLIASPKFHRWHHADVPEAHGKNLANVMPIFDVLFGTYYYPGPCTAPLGALKSGIEDKNALLIYVYPFQEWARLAKEAISRLSGSWAARKARTDARALESQKQS